MHTFGGSRLTHPLMLWAIAAAKNKNDRIDINKVTDGLHCDFLPDCYMAWPRRRFASGDARSVIEICWFADGASENRIAGLLMEAGVSYNQEKLHKIGYFRGLLKTNSDIDLYLQTDREF
jgi:transposase